MLSKEEIEAEELAMKIYRVQESILEEIKRNGEVSYFKEDVLYIIHKLLETQLTKQEQTACEIVCRRQENFLRLEKEKHLKNKIQQLKADNYEQNNIINSYIEREQKLIEKLEEYKKALKQDGIYGYDIEINEILKILKGES